MRRLAASDEIPRKAVHVMIRCGQEGRRVFHARNR